MTNGLTNSDGSPRFNSFEAIAVCAALAVVIAAFATWIALHHYVLSYGDAQAHLTISRGVVDSRTPGYDQLGSVWLPVLHVLCLPFVWNDALWSSGLAGTIPVGICFVAAATFFYVAARDAYRSSAAALVAVACFALNPNLLYLASIPMTEVVFFAGLSCLLFALIRFRQTQNRWLILVGIVACWWMSLTRYDGWFLIPFAGLAFCVFAKQSRFHILIAFGAFASLAPLYWFAHTWWETGDALSFYRGPYSAKGIQGGLPYPGQRDWYVALKYYAVAGRLCAGVPLIILGGVGTVCAVMKRVLAPSILLALTPAFYVWSLHSSDTPIHVPVLWPFSYYNTRYGLAVVPLAAMAAGAIVLVIPPALRKWVVAIPLVAISVWLVHPSSENWICWKESRVNSNARRAWTNGGADFFRRNYVRGEGILVSSGDVQGVLCASRIPMSESLQIGNEPEWDATTSRLDLLHPEKWAIAQDGDSLAKAIARHPVYQAVEAVRTKDAPVLRIYVRTEAPNDAGTVH